MPPIGLIHLGIQPGDMSVEVTVGGTPTGDLTLAFGLVAIERFAAPTDVFADARSWSRYVGVVDNDHDGIRRFLESHDLDSDFALGGADLWLALEAIHEATATPRYVYVGTDPDQRRAADHLGWEFKQPETVAAKADWRLTDESADPQVSGDQAGVLARLRRLLGRS